MEYIETERLVLRSFTEEDAHPLFLILSDEEVNIFLPMFPLRNIEEAKVYLHGKYIGNRNETNGLRYAICLKEENIPIGYVHVTDDDSHDLGYGLRKEFWHRGIVSEACKRVVEIVRKDGMPYITATHDVNNPRSGNVMRAIGMKYQYTYEELWQPKNILVHFRMYQLNFDESHDMVYKKYWDKYPIHCIEKF